ncbi:MAG: VTT domain-containing protein [Actinobacteria bacterium]|nr:VTT domain-containing protein [Actinomycetota bacterium]
MDSFLHFLLNPSALLQQWVTILGAIAYIVIFAIIFAESGLLVGFFLPGDSLLFAAGFLAAAKIPNSSHTYLNIWILIIVTFIGAVSGDSVGFTFGYRVGRKLFQRENSRFFNKENLVRAQGFYERHGTKTIVLARFVPIIRTFAPIVAGIGKMNYKTFIAFNIIGGALWSVAVPLAGYYLGQIIPNIDKYLLPIIVVIVIVSAIPAILNFLRSRRKKDTGQTRNK